MGRGSEGGWVDGCWRGGRWSGWKSEGWDCEERQGEESSCFLLDEHGLKGLKGMGYLRREHSQEC